MKKSDDRLALGASLLGAATALLGLRAPLTLTTGVAVGLAGVLLAVRGDRPVLAARPMWIAVAIAIASVVATALIGFYEEWDIGQRLAEGMPPSWVTEQVRPWARAVAGLRSLGLFAALAFLLGAVMTRLGPAKPDPTSGK